MKGLVKSLPGASCLDELRTMALTWAVAAAAPLPVLVAIDPTRSAPVACAYLGMACAWLVTEFWRTLGAPESAAAWRSRTMAILVASLGCVGLFVAFGLAAGVASRFPLPLMALLSAAPAVGMMPWMLRRTGHPFAAFVFTASLMFAAKLAACVAVIVFIDGEHYMERGLIAADWRTAKVMISLMWTFSTLMSFAFLAADFLNYERSERHALRDEQFVSADR